MDQPLSILVLGASYGLLPGLKLALAGHRVTLVGRAEEIAAMAASGLAVDLPLRRSGERITLAAPVATNAAPLRPALRTPASAEIEGVDFAILALQEPQYAASEIVALVARIAEARLPCLSIMNLPPPPFLKRLGLAGDDALSGVYSSMAAWDLLDPEQVTLASPDPQAIRLDPSSPGMLTVTLASNFKAAPFADGVAQAKLECIAHDMSHLKVPSAAGEVRAPVALMATQSLHVPLAKWPMLLAGNCRCVLPGGTRSIAEAVMSDTAASRSIYETVTALVGDLGARHEDLVSFDAYTKAAVRLSRPSSLARALAAGATAVERIDRLVLNLIVARELDPLAIAPLVERIDAALRRNRESGDSLGSTD